MSELEKMLKGMLYQAGDKTLTLMREKASNLCYDYNHLRPTEYQKKQDILKQLLGSMGTDVHINQPFLVDYGCHIFIGDHFFANYNFTVLDIGTVTIGNHVMIGPNVGLMTAGHPLDSEIRNELHEFGYDITIKDDVWIGANVIINPGVTVGKGVVIGSGSVVTKDLSDHMLCYGKPCKEIRKITDQDKLIWEKEKQKSLKHS
ncbi:MAG: sugar O-acetyltransferase [Acholeplasmataceae bacterium]|nr:sugar O-acetyltransferase [Acholeplasmataceae bacterium]